MKAIYILPIFFFSIIFSGCKQNIIETEEKVDNTTLANYCTDNWWYVATENNVLSCFFENSYCGALAFYKWECLNEPYISNEYDEAIAEEKCESAGWSIEVLNSWWDEIKICFLADDTICSLQELYDWECIEEY